MKNFLRALRYSWRYRKRLIFSIFCALIAAGLWGLNFTAIYPVLKVVGEKKTLHQWVEERIDETQAEIDQLSPEVARVRNELRNIEKWQDDALRNREEAKTAEKLARLESRLDSASSRHWRYHWLKQSVIRWLPPDPFQTVAWILIIVVIGIALKGVFEFLHEYLVGSVTTRTLYDLRNRFYRHSVHQDMRHFQEKGSSELMSRFTNDMEVVGNGMKILYGRVIAEPLKALSCIIIACLISWQLTLMFLIVIPAALYIMMKTSRMMKRATRRVLERMSSIYKILQETFQGIRVVKAFTMEPYERRRFQKATRDYRDRSMRVVIIDALAGPTVELLGVAAVSIALLAGAYLVLNQKTHLFGMRMSHTPIEMETLFQLFALLAATADPVRKLSSVYTKIQSAAAGADRVFACMDRVAEVGPNNDGPRLRPHRKSIEFRNVCFSYQQDKEVLTNVSLTVRHGETIAIVGSNGCGKSTLLGLVPRFYDPNYGSIFIDGMDVRKVKLRTLRQQIGIVTQDTVLFDDTILNNILYGNRQASHEDAIAAAKQAFAHEVIERLPHSYATMAGEAGKSLSGGEKQRIALARAMLRNPSILILDEFTSQVDAESETKIHDALQEFKRGRTTFLITHKMHTLQVADRIVVLDQGRIEAVGTIERLMEISPTFQRLFEGHYLRRTASVDESTSQSEDRPKKSAAESEKDGGAKGTPKLPMQEGQQKSPAEPPKKPMDDGDRRVA